MNKKILICIIFFCYGFCASWGQTKDTAESLFDAQIAIVNELAHYTDGRNWSTLKWNGFTGIRIVSESANFYAAFEVREGRGGANSAKYTEMYRNSAASEMLAKYPTYNIISIFEQVARDNNAVFIRRTENSSIWLYAQRYQITIEVISTGIAELAITYKVNKLPDRFGR